METAWERGYPPPLFDACGGEIDLRDKAWDKAWDKGTNEATCVHTHTTLTVDRVGETGTRFAFITEVNKWSAALACGKQAGERNVQEHMWQHGNCTSRMSGL